MRNALVLLNRKKEVWGIEMTWEDSESALERTSWRPIAMDMSELQREKRALCPPLGLGPVTLLSLNSTVSQDLSEAALGF